ncbi:hypothetical protein ACQPZP_09885 [Spirillospora sp. CA-142024]|uniref:hypothetical protein n=1 Tax=Spirillospora sp. CA-142024 TaxID=3240036 RepID=UPI003D9151F2
MWRPDGWDVTGRIGVLTPHADVGPESELRAMAPNGVGVHASRVEFGATRAGGGMDPTIPPEPVRAFARLEGRTGGIPVVATCTAALRALRMLEARSIALLDPSPRPGCTNGFGGTCPRESTRCSSAGTDSGPWE